MHAAGAASRSCRELDPRPCKPQMWLSKPPAKTWSAENGAIFDLTSNRLRPIGWTSADAAGLAIYPGLVKYEETVVQKQITHAIRVTFDTTQVGYDPNNGATHQATHNTRERRTLPAPNLRNRTSAAACAGWVEAMYTSVQRL